MDILLDPNFAQNGYYYIFYTRGRGSQNHNRVSRFTASGNATVPGSEVRPVGGRRGRPRDGHHGADLPSATTASSTSRSASIFDRRRAATRQFRGKILRINMDGTIPTDNPFYDGAGPNRDAIWAYGLRNPFRMSIDPVTGKMYIGDVGGNDDTIAIEEVNLGVARRELRLAACAKGTCGVSGTTNPIYSYPHDGRDASITGGIVYRGSQFPSRVRRQLLLRRLRAEHDQRLQIRRERQRHRC